MKPPDWNLPSITEASFFRDLVDGDIAIRPYRPDDAAAAFEAVSSSVTELTRWMPWCHPDYGFAESEAWVSTRADAWARGDEISFVIISATDDRFLGAAGLNEINRSHLTANLGYWVRTDATRRGVASRAARLLARFGCVHLGLRRIEIVAALGNTPSQRAAEKAGAAREAVLRNRVLIHGESHDAVVFSFIPADFGLA